MSSKELLLLGGTGWLGPYVAQSAIDSGLSVTVLSRGQRGPAPKGVRSVHGDRTRPDGYEAVLGQDWDYVIDTSIDHDQIQSALTALSTRTGWWGFVSSTAVYTDRSGTPDENSATVIAPDDTAAGHLRYPQAKIAGEQGVTAAMGDRSLIARSGLLIGPGDISDRFGYWVSRFAALDNDPILVPKDLNQPVQAFDVRDLAGWLIESLHARRAGTFNAVGPTWSLGKVLDAARAVTGSMAQLVPADETWLTEHDVAPMLGPRSLPLWQPDSAQRAPQVVDDGRILRAGRNTRSLEETTADSLAFERELGLDRERRSGLTRTDERELIHALTAS